MIVAIDRSFEKDTDKIKDRKLLLQIAGSIEKAREVQTHNEIRHLKKLKGFSQHYRIRIGEYRLGVIIQGEAITFIRCLHRKEVYRYFP